MTIPDTHTLQKLAFAAFGLIVGVAAGHLTVQQPSRETPQITLTAEALALQVVDRAALIGRDLRPEEVDRLIARQVAVEVLVREAAKLDIHLKDADVRKHIVAVMQHVLSNNVPEPSPEDLAEILAKRADDYMTPRKFTFEHVFFEDDPEAAGQVAEQVRAGGEVPEKTGDVFWLGRRMEEYSGSQLLTLLGHEFTRTIASMPTNVWSDPVKSARGLHVVRVETVHEPVPLQAEELEARLTADWKKAQQSRDYKAQVAAMSANYRIELPDQQAIEHALALRNREVRVAWPVSRPAE